MNDKFYLPRATPESQGIPSAAIEAFVRAADCGIDSLHSFMLVRHGQVVAAGWWDPYGPDERHSLFSLSKSFTSTGIGLLVEEGRLSVEERVVDIFSEYTPADPGEHLQAMRVRHLLTMSTGHAADTIQAMMGNPLGNWVESFLSLPVEFEPGTQFLYNTGATYVLSAIISKRTGERLLDFLQPRLFDPLGIRDPQWETSPQGIDAGGWGLSLTTAEIAAFGQLYLQKGIWNGVRLLPEDWIKSATSKQINNSPASNIDWEQGYGYQFWRCRHNAFRGDGAFGQYCVVMPEQDAVLAMTGGMGEMQLPLNLAWEHLLPAMRNAPLPDDPAAQADLTESLSNLRLPAPAGTRESPLAVRFSSRSFRMEPNLDQVEEICFDFGEAETLVTFRNDQGEQRLACGSGAWPHSQVHIYPADAFTRHFTAQLDDPWKAAASSAWIDDATFTVKMWWYETPFARTFTFRFEGDHLTVEQQANFSFFPVEGPVLHGQLSV